MKTIEEKRTLSRWFAANANWCVLFVQTYEERRVASRIQDKLDKEVYAVFVPMKNYVHKKQGKTTVRKIPWLSGYVFVAAMVEAEELANAVSPLILLDSTIYKLLSNDGDHASILLSEKDKALLTALLDENFNIPPLEALVVGDKVELINNPLDGFDGEVLRVNLKKKTAMVRLKLLERTMDCELALELMIPKESTTINTPKNSCV
ncbi:hypothetical protein AGMMS49957_17460 [Synergistales bacterium]|nr:hypothetical protein AGMMS49957_17460 [Synergistales bacterium]